MCDRMNKGTIYETEKERWFYLGTAHNKNGILKFNDGVESIINQCIVGPYCLRARLDFAVEAVSFQEHHYFLDKLSGLSSSTMSESMIRFFTANCVKIDSFLEKTYLGDDFDLELEGDLYIFQAENKNDENYRRVVFIRADEFDRERGLRFKELLN